MKRLVTLSMCASLAVFGTLPAVAATVAPKDIQLPSETVKLRPSALAGYAVAEQKCSICHSADYISYQPPGMTQTQWTAEMAKMQHMYGAPIDDAEVKLLGIYLAAAYGDAKSVSAADLAPGTHPGSTVPLAVAAASQSAPATTVGAVDVPSVLGNNACLSCHALNQTIIGPAYHDVAERYKADPGAIARLQASIKAGGVGKWGQAPMPPFGGLSEAELKALAEFVMKQ